MTRMPPQNLMPFAPANNAESTFKSACGDYGLQPDSTPHMARLAECLEETLSRCAPHSWSAVGKSSLRAYLCETELLNPHQCVGSPDGYRRHLLYVSPDKSFSVMSVVWQPGQRSPVHGHTAWGAVGVYSGKPFCENYSAEQTGYGSITYQQLETIRLKPGDLATVDAGLGTIHRIGNDGFSPAVTVHIYGKDLLANPAAINFFVAN